MNPIYKPLLAITFSLAFLASSHGALYSNGFETNTTDWNAAATRVASGTNGISSSSGSFHAQNTTSGTPFSFWGGNNFGAGNAVPTAFQEYTTSIDIFLNVGGGFANNSRFDFSSAINNSATGIHLQDFIYNAGFYNSGDVTGPGAGTDRFVISASTNAQPGSAFAKNPANSPIAIGTTGWYTFEHHFYDNAGSLAVDMSIYDSSDALVNGWTVNSLNLIGTAGGNRYGWFDYNQLPVLAFDNASLTIVPEPSMAIVGLLLVGSAVIGRNRRRSAAEVSAMH